MSLTFKNYRVAAEGGGIKLVYADCVETGEEAYAVLKSGEPMSAAKDKLAKIQPRNAAA